MFSMFTTLVFLSKLLLIMSKNQSATKADEWRYYVIKIRIGPKIGT